MNLRVLLADSDAEDLLFLEDVLIEMEEGPHWGPWIGVETMAASSLGEILTLLGAENVDVILLNLSLQDSKGAATFRRVQAARPDSPIILIIRPEERELAAQLIREGAQDFLNQKQLDCAPLAHAMRNAIERQRLLNAARATAIVDPLTGLLNRGGFFTFGSRDRLLAERLGQRWMVIAAEPRDFPHLATAQGEQRRDLTLMEVADSLRGVTTSTHLLARIAESRFALTIFDTPLESIETAWARLRMEAAEQRIAIGTAIFDTRHPASFDLLLEQAEADLALALAPKALAMRP